MYKVLCHMQMCKGEKAIGPKGADSVAKMMDTYTKPCNTRFTVTSHVIGLQSKFYGDTGEGSSLT